MYVWVIRLVLLFVILTIVYIALSWYTRWNRGRELRSAFDATNETSVSRDQYVANGLAQYQRSIRRRLILGVYLLPMAIVVALLIIANLM